jgi:predicted transcriptional regulator
MHDFLLPDQIRSRADRIGLTPHRLCEMSEVHPSTFSRILNSDVSWRVSTLRKLTAALTAHELALRDHLVALHGCETAQAEAAEVPA